MQVKKIYTGKKGFEEVKKQNKSVETLDNFFKINFQYSKNYHRNLETLEIIEVDDLKQYEADGLYYPDTNIIRISDVKNAMSHELTHMASTDIKGKKTFSTCKKFNEFTPLAEGMTEYLKFLATSDKVNAYLWEAFAAEMLTMTDENTIRAYFNASSEKFISLFDKKDIYNIIINLFLTNSDVYPTEYNDVLNFQKNVRTVLESLVNIELASTKDKNKLRLYRELYLSLLENENLKYEFLLKNYKGYHNYAKKLTDRLIGK